MAKAQMKEEEKQILQFIQQNWPDFEDVEKELRDLSSEFVTRFFRTYFIDLHKECAAMFGEGFELIGDVTQHFPADIDHDDGLYVHIKNILAKIGVEYISLLDILKPQNRTRTAIKIAVNFLMYVKQVTHRGDVLHEIVTANKALEQMTSARAALKDDIAKTSEQIGFEMEELEAANLKYEKELQFEEELGEEDPEIEKLRREIEALEDAERTQDLENLEQEELALQGKVVPEDESKFLTERVSELTASVQEIDKANGEIDENTKEKRKDKDYLHSISSLLSSVDCNSWGSIAKIEEVRKATEMVANLHDPVNTEKHHNTIKNMEVQLKLLHNQFISERKYHENCCHLHDQKYSQLQKHHQAECECQDKLIKEHTNARKDYESCKCACSQIEDEIKEIIEFNSQMYEQFLNNYSKIATTFDNVMQLPDKM